MKPLKLSDPEQLRCANELISLIEDTIGVLKTQIDETEKSVTIITSEDVEEFNEQWIRRWSRKSCFTDILDSKRGITITDDKIKLFFLNPVKTK